MSETCLESVNTQLGQYFTSGNPLFLPAGPVEWTQGLVGEILYLEKGLRITALHTRHNAVKIYSTHEILEGK